MPSKKLTCFLLKHVLKINTPRRLIEFIARRNSDKIILEQDEKQYTFKDINLRANKLARALTEKGIGKGQKIGVWLKNRVEFIEIRLACYKLGLVFCAFIDDFTEKQALQKLNEMAFNVFIFDNRAENIIKLIDKKSKPGLFISLDKRNQENIISYSDFLREGKEEVPNINVKPKEIAAIGFTSGTTGISKGVVWDNQAWITSFYNFFLNATPVSGEMVMLQFLPMSTAASLSVLPWLASGGKMLLLDKYDPEIICRTITEKRATHIIMAPYFLIDLWDFYQNNREKYDLSSLKSISVGSAALPGEKLKQMIKTFGPIISQSYGMSENLAPLASLCITNPDKEADQLTSVGKPILQISLKLVDINQDGIGRIAIKSKTTTLGYWGKEKLNTSAIQNAWFITEDLGKIDNEGNVYIIERTNNVNTVNGLKLYPRLLEEKIHKISGIKDVSLIVTGEKAVVYFTEMRNPKVNLEDLEKMCSTLFVPFALDFEIIRLEKFVVSSSGKILKNSKEYSVKN